METRKPQVTSIKASDWLDLGGLMDFPVGQPKRRSQERDVRQELAGQVRSIGKRMQRSDTGMDIHGFAVDTVGGRG